MGKSAQVLGSEVGLTAQEVNLLLKEEGFLYGKPGAYGLTEKGLGYAQEQYHHRGTGGYPTYNRHWETRVWDPSVMDQIDLTEGRKREIRDAIATARRGLAGVAEATADRAVDALGDEDSGSDDKKVAVVVAVGFVVLAASVYGIHKASPYVVRWWRNSAVPGFAGARQKVLGRLGLDEEAPRDEADDEDPSADPEG